jgi:hypothetical protein
MSPLQQALQSLSFLSLRLVVKAVTSLWLPPFKGSTLHGGFGHAFKETVCVVDHRDCARCLFRTRCTYPYVFDTPVPEGATRMRKCTQAPHPFVLPPPPAAGLDISNAPLVTMLDGDSVLTYAAITTSHGVTGCNSSWTSLARLPVVPTDCTGLVRHR